MVGKHLSAAANASHYLVNYEQDVILVAKSPNALDDFGWVNQHTCRAGDCLYHQCSYCSWVLVDNGLLHVGKVVGDGVLLIVSPPELEGLEVEELNEATNSVLSKATSKITSGV